VDTGLFFREDEYVTSSITTDHLLSDRSPNIQPLISRWEPDKLKNCSNKSFRNSKIFDTFISNFRTCWFLNEIRVVQD
jgi:hypothetical protein